MPGGTWSTTNMPVLPGFYLNFVSAAIASIEQGARGIVALPVKAHWGPVRKFQTISSEADITSVYTDDITTGATARTALYFGLLGGAKQILAYRLADASAAPESLKLQDTTADNPVYVIQLDTIYPTDRAFKAAVSTNIIDNTKKDIKFYEGSALLHTFTVGGNIQAVVDAINNDSANVWVKASKLADGNGTLSNVSALPFAGGNPGISNVLATDYTDFMAAAEGQIFNLFTLDGITDPAIQTSVTAWVKRVRSEGMGIIAVLGGSTTDDSAADAVNIATTRSAGFDFEGVVNVGDGVILDGVTYSSAQVACFVAGLIAGKALNESTTYAATPFDDVSRRWSRAEQEIAVQNGVFLLIYDGKIVKPLTGINSLINLSSTQNKSWKKIRAIRVMDAFNSDMLSAAEENYIGKVNNNDEGRLALLGAFKAYMEVQAGAGVIETTGWDVYLDPDYYGDSATKTPDRDQVFPVWTAVLTDTMEQILGKFIVQ